MARTTKTNAFDVDAYLASANTGERKTIAGWFADKFDNVAQRAAYRAGQVTESLSGTGEVYEMGKKVGAIRAAAVQNDFRARAKADIEALLAARS